MLPFDLPLTNLYRPPEGARNGEPCWALVKGQFPPFTQQEIDYPCSSTAIGVGLLCNPVRFTSSGFNPPPTRKQPERSSRKSHVFDEDFQNLERTSLYRALLRTLRKRNLNSFHFFLFRKNEKSAASLSSQIRGEIVVFVVSRTLISLPLDSDLRKI